MHDEHLFEDTETIMIHLGKSPESGIYLERRLFPLTVRNIVGHAFESLSSFATHFFNLLFLVKCPWKEQAAHSVTSEN